MQGYIKKEIPLLMENQLSDYIIKLNQFLLRLQKKNPKVLQI